MRKLLKVFGERSRDSGERCLQVSWNISSNSVLYRTTKPGNRYTCSMVLLSQPSLVFHRCHRRRGSIVRAPDHAIDFSDYLRPLCTFSLLHSPQGISPAFPLSCRSSSYPTPKSNTQRLQWLRSTVSILHSLSTLTPPPSQSQLLRLSFTPHFSHRNPVFF